MIARARAHLLLVHGSLSLIDPLPLGSLRADPVRAGRQRPSNPALRLDVQRERDVVEGAFKQLNSILDFVSYFVGTIMAIGATLGMALAW